MKRRLMLLIKSTWTYARTRPGPEKALSAALLLVGVLGAEAQVITISPAAQQAHASITTYNGPSTCVACHQSQAQAMFGSVHYQEMADTPAVPNVDGAAGKGNNGGRVMNSYCGTPSTSSRATCATCHVGNGRIPSTTLSTEQLNNIDCLMCHQDAYKRVPTGTFQTVTMPGPTAGSTHTIQAVVEDATGFDFIPDTAKMTVTLLDAARTVHKPTRASCLRCHAGAGGSDGGKRGDISTVTANPPVTSDIHMSPQGNNLGCVNCHSAGGHRVRGRGIDLRPSDSTQRLECTSCHNLQPHPTTIANASVLNVHAARVACQTCHIPTYAKDKSTEMERSWLGAVFSQAACRGQGGWLPEEVRASNVVPSYSWFDGTSIANVLNQVPVQNSSGEYMLALPNGSVQSAGAKIYPMKVHRSDSARQDSTGLLIPHSTFEFFTSGDFDQAVLKGQSLSGLSGAASVVPVIEYQTINHGVEAKANALQCGACHSAYTTGGPLRMNLKTDLGYALKAPTTTLCSSCHGAKTAGFASVHSRHVTSRNYDCSRCHTFSRPERGLSTPVGIVPTAPTGPAALAVSATQIKLVWGDNSSTEEGFRIERSLNPAGPYNEIGTVAANATTLTDSSVSVGNSYYYRVRAYNSTGTSAYSMYGRATPMSTTPPPGTVPTAPSGLSAVAISSTRVNLAWTDNSSNESSFEVQRATGSSGTFASLASVGANTTTYSDTTAAPSTSYQYRVRAVNATGNSGYASVSVTTPAPPVTAPAAPTGISATAGDRTVTLQWTASAGATSYTVRRSTTSGSGYTLVSSGITSTSYTDNSVANGTTYYYVIAAVNSGGTSPNSTQASATPRAPATTVSAPTQLQIEAKPRARMQLQWEQSSSPGITQNRIYRRTGSSSTYSLVATISAGSTYLDTGLTRRVTYQYVVTAVNASNQESGYSSSASATAK